MPYVAIVASGCTFFQIAFMSIRVVIHGVVFPLALRGRSASVAETSAGHDLVHYYCNYQLIRIGINPNVQINVIYCILLQIKQTAN